MSSFLKKLALRIKPDYIYDKVQDIDADMLKSKGIKGIIIDLDNTLIPWKEFEIPGKSIDWVCKMQEKGFVFFILSNTTNVKRLKSISEILNIDYLHPAAKPSKKSFVKARSILGFNSNEMAVVGDQLFTDVLGGKKTGMTTILVNPLSNREFIGTKIISRNLEKILKKHMQ